MAPFFWTSHFVGADLDLIPFFGVAILYDLEIDLSLWHNARN